MASNEELYLALQQLVECFEPTSPPRYLGVEVDDTTEEAIAYAERILADETEELDGDVN